MIDEIPGINCSPVMSPCHNCGLANSGGDNYAGGVQFSRLALERLAGMELGEINDRCNSCHFTDLDKLSVVSRGPFKKMHCQCAGG